MKYQADFDHETLTYIVNSQEIEDIVGKAAASAPSRLFKTSIRILTQRLQNEQITLQEWYDGMQQEVKYLHMAEAALARGGWSEMREQDWEKVSTVVKEQWEGAPDKFPGLRKFAEDIQRGRYGTDVLNPRILSRAGMYAEAGRATYENERLLGRMEVFPLEARRILGDVRHCHDCPAWAGLGWMPAGVMAQDFPIGASECNVHCYCSIVNRRMKIDEKVEGWNGVQQAIRLAAAATGTVALAGGALVVLSYAKSNPSQAQWALTALQNAVEAWAKGRRVAM